MTPDHAVLIPLRRLALAVIDTAAKDAHAGRQDADAFLDDDQSLSPWSWFLGLQPATVRRAARGPHWPEQHAKARRVLTPERLTTPTPASPSPDPEPVQDSLGFEDGLQGGDR
jgi:hypothetical protein